ncbi:MAG: DUF898 family protein [Bryobacteraceae bacterium]
MPFCTACGHNVEGADQPCPRCRPDLLAARPFSFHGSGGALLKIYLVTFLLSIVTVGIYSFWGRAKARRYIAGSVEFLGDRFRYHGTGGEMLRGFVAAALILAILVGQMFLWMFALGEDRGAAIGTGVLVLASILLGPIATVGAWRYRLSRTSWREIRFSFHGRTGEFVWIFVKGFLLSVVTLMLYTPWFTADIHRFLVSNTRFGDARFQFDGHGRDLFKPFAIALLLAIPTLTISLYWFQIQQANYFFGHTTILGSRFQLNLTMVEFFGTFLGAYMIAVFTLFVGYPWAQCMVLRHVFSRLSLAGHLPLDQIHQSLSDASATGDMLGQLMDSGGLDISLGL